MEHPPNAPFNLDSFIRKRADEQRQQQREAPRTTPPAPSPPQEPEAKQTAQATEEPPLDTPAEHSTQHGHAAHEASQKERMSSETAKVLAQSTRSAQQNQHKAREAVSQLQTEAESSQARLAAEAAQEAAQASLEAIEFAHQAARSAIEEASAGRQQKRTYNTQRLLVTLNIALLVAAFLALYLFVLPTIQLQPPPPTANTTTPDKTTEHLTQQLLLDTQRERLRSEQELALMEQSLARLIEEQKALREHLNETKTLLNNERERKQQETRLNVTFSKMEQDLKQRISELEQRLERQIPMAAASAPAPALPTAPKTVSQADTSTAETAPTEVLQRSGTSNRGEKEVDEILQKLYSLHTQLSEQRASAPAAERSGAATESSRPYSYNRR